MWISTMAELNSEILFGQIERGKLYDLSVEDPQNSSFLTLGFYFKPSQISARSAALHISDSNEATLEYHGTTNARDFKENGVEKRILESSESGEKGGTFKGSCVSEMSSNARNVVNEYLLSFEKDSFKLSRVDTSIRNLRPVRNDETNKGGLDAEKSKKMITNALKILKNGKKRKLDPVSSPTPKSQITLPDDLVISTSPDIKS